MVQTGRLSSRPVVFHGGMHFKSFQTPTAGVGRVLNAYAREGWRPRFVCPTSWLFSLVVLER